VWARVGLTISNIKGICESLVMQRSRIPELQILQIGPPAGQQAGSQAATHDCLNAAAAGALCTVLASLKSLQLVVVWGLHEHTDMVIQASLQAGFQSEDNDGDQVGRVRLVRR